MKIDKPRYALKSFSKWSKSAQKNEQKFTKNTKKQNSAKTKKF